MSSWHDTYTGKLRKLVGTQKLLSNSVRAIICNEQGDALFIRRRGDRKWGMPAGAMELNESVHDGLKREVKEETGLDVISATLIAIYSDPKNQSFTDRYGNEYQVIEYLFRVDEWSGVLERVTEESVDAKFFPIDALPEASNEFFARHHERVFRDFRSFEGRLILRQSLLQKQHSALKHADAFVEEMKGNYDDTEIYSLELFDYLVDWLARNKADQFS